MFGEEEQKGVKLDRHGRSELMVLLCKKSLTEEEFLRANKLIETEKVNRVTNVGKNTALMCLVGKSELNANDFKLAELLVKKWGVCHRNKADQDALMLLCYRGELNEHGADIAELIIERVANINSVDIRDQTALMYLSSREKMGFFGVRIGEMLANSGANIGLKSKLNETALTILSKKKVKDKHDEELTEFLGSSEQKEQQIRQEPQESTMVYVPDGLLETAIQQYYDGNQEEAKSRILSFNLSEEQMEHLEGWGLNVQEWLGEIAFASEEKTTENKGATSKLKRTESNLAKVFFPTVQITDFVADNNVGPSTSDDLLATLICDSDDFCGAVELAANNFQNDNGAQYHILEIHELNKDAILGMKNPSDIAILGLCLLEPHTNMGEDAYDKIALLSIKQRKKIGLYCLEVANEKGDKLAAHCLDTNRYADCNLEDIVWAEESSNVEIKEKEVKTLTRKKQIYIVDEFTAALNIAIEGYCFGDNEDKKQEALAKLRELKLQNPGVVSEALDNFSIKLPDAEEEVKGNSELTLPPRGEDIGEEHTKRVTIRVENGQVVFARPKKNITNGTKWQERCGTSPDPELPPLPPPSPSSSSVTSSSSLVSVDFSSDPNGEKKEKGGFGR